VRQTERPWLALGGQVQPLARAAQAGRHGAPQRSEEQQRRRDTQLAVALKAHHRLTPGQAVPHGKIVNAYAPPLAPMCTGKRNDPAPFGRTPGIIAEPAAGCLLARHRPVGHPSAAR
jgi:hypothetical protein